MKINTGDPTKLTSFCTAKETINKRKKQPTSWENIVAKDATDKSSISKICNSHRVIGEGCTALSAETLSGQWCLLALGPSENFRDDENLGILS